MTKVIAPAISAVSAGTEQKNFGTVVFSNSNNVTFGLNGSVLTASANAAGAGDGYNIIAAGTQTAATSGSVVFSNSNGITFGMSNSSIVTASHNGLTSQSNQALSGSNGSFAFQTATFGNLNGASFYTTNGSMALSYTVPSQTTQPAIQSISGGTTRITTGEVVFSNSNGVSFGVNGQTITASHNGLTSQSNQAASAANGSFAFQTLSFSNLNGISFGTSAGSAITASHNALTSQSNQAISAGNGSFTFQTASFADSNGVSFSTGTQGIYATVKTDYLTSQSNQAFSADGGSSAFQTLNFRNANGISFSNSNGSVQASYTVPTQTAQTLGVYGSSQTTGQSSSSTFDARSLSFRGAGIVSVGASAGEWIISATAGGGAGDGVNILAAGTQTANTTGTVLFNDANGITFGMNNSSVITASHNGLTSQSNQAFSAQGGSSAFQTLVFTNSNGISFSNTNGSIWGSHNGLTSQSNQALSGSNGSFTFQTATLGNLNGASFYTSNGSMVMSYTVPSVPAQTAQTMGMYAVSNTTGQSSSTTLDARTISFHGAGIASVGYSAGSVVISVPAGGGGGDGVNILAAGTQTANTTGTVVFSNSNGVTFGMSNSSVITASVDVPAGYTQSWWNPHHNYPMSTQTMGNASLQFRVQSLPVNISFDRVVDMVSFSNATNSTMTVTVSISHAIYSRNDSSLSLISSTSNSFAVTGSGTVRNSVNIGARLFTTPWSMSLSQGVYHLAMWSRTTTGGANASISNLCVNMLLANFSGFINQTVDRTNCLSLGNGNYSVTISTAMPSAVSLTQIDGTANANAHYWPVHYFTNGSL